MAEVSLSILNIKFFAQSPHLDPALVGGAKLLAVDLPREHQLVAVVTQYFSVV